MSLDFPMTELDASALLAFKAHKETLPIITKRLNINENRLLNMIEGKEPLCRRVMRDLGLRREIRYRQVK